MATRTKTKPTPKPLNDETNYATKSRAQKVLDKHEQLKAIKAPWLATWQFVGLYVLPRKQDFFNQVQDGANLTGQIFDSTAPRANQQMASSIIGAIWPNGSKTFVLDPPDDMDFAESKKADVKDYYLKASKRMYGVMDNPEAGLTTSIDEYMLDQPAFGVSGIFAEENFDTDEFNKPVRYYAVDCKKACIMEGKDGFVDTVYVERSITVKQLIQEYGVDNVSKKSRDAWDNNKQNEKVRVLHAIEPRIEGVKNIFGNQFMPIASIHIEMDAPKILKESGYSEMPVFVTRFWKANGEVYGRSPATESMPDIIAANVMGEAFALATEKQLDPPGILSHDGSIGGGTVDMSAGAITIRNTQGRLNEANHKVWEQLVTVGDMTPTAKYIEMLVENIKQAFFIDRLTDFNNDTRMTLGEANMRDQMRGQSLNTTYSRQISEMFSRLVQRTFHIMLGKGLLGVVKGSPQYYDILRAGGTPWIIPDAIAKRMLGNQHSYKVTFISPAIRIMRAEELSGIMNILTVVEKIAPVNPEILDAINFDALIYKMQELTGAPSEILNSLERIQAIRTNRNQMQQQQMQAQQTEQMALTAKHAGQAAQATTKSGLPPLTLLQGGGQRQAA
jgi:hypothetical protein